MQRNLGAVRRCSSLVVAESNTPGKAMRMPRIPRCDGHELSDVKLYRKTCVKL